MDAELPLVAATKRNLRKVPAIWWLVILWSIATLPNLSVRAFIWEEGNNVMMARDILNGGSLWEPEIYGVRFVEKPSLTAWLIAGVSLLTGGVGECSARLPSMLALLVTSLLVFRLTRSATNERAALFAGLCFLLCPQILQKLTIAEPDAILTALSFSAFYVWWKGYEKYLGLGRWVVCGLLLAAAGMAKGPQPLAFFITGVGGFLVFRKDWKQLPGFSLCLAIPTVAIAAWAAAVHQPGDVRMWMGYMRLAGGNPIFEYLANQQYFISHMLLVSLPGILLLPALPSLLRDQNQSPLTKALLCYAGIALLVLCLWPHSKSRYAMPAAPAIAVLAGLAFNAPRFWMRAPLRKTAAGILVGAILYQVTLTWIVMPVFKTRFGQGRTDGLAIDAAISQNPAPVFNVYKMSNAGANQLFYVSHPIQRISLDEALGTEFPAWFIAQPDLFKRIQRSEKKVRFQKIVRAKAGVNLVSGLAVDSE